MNSRLLEIADLLRLRSVLSGLVTWMKLNSVEDLVGLEICLLIDTLTYT